MASVAVASVVVASVAVASVAVASVADPVIVPNDDAPIDELYRARLVLFFERHCRELLPSVDSTLRRVRGMEEALFAALCGKYGPEL